MTQPDENLNDLLKVIRGESGLPPGITTYPEEPDENQKQLHQACLDLERQGLIFRAREAPADADSVAFIIWKALPCNHESFAVGQAVSRTMKQDGSVKSYLIHIRVACADCRVPFVFDGDPKIIRGLELRAPVRPKVQSSIIIPKFNLRGRKPLDQ